VEQERAEPLVKCERFHRAMPEQGYQPSEVASFRCHAFNVTVRCKQKQTLSKNRKSDTNSEFRVEGDTVRSASLLYTHRRGDDRLGFGSNNGLSRWAVAKIRNSLSACSFYYTLIGRCRSAAPYFHGKPFRSSSAIPPP
jgi:hypothetical protein